MNPENILSWSRAIERLLITATAGKGTREIRVILYAKELFPRGLECESIQ
jgi:DNA transposition AAA+ family ATPase